MPAIRSYLVRKLLSIPAKLFAVLVVTFLIIQLAPTGPLDRLLMSLHEWLIDDGTPPAGPLR
jgi:ABC-type microcin C transport system permease subunit YejB